MSEYTVTFTGRGVEIPDHFAQRVEDKLTRVAKLDPSLQVFDVVLSHEDNPRREDQSDRVQITATGSGHLARAEAKSDSFYAALELALDKMERSLRKVKVRREVTKSGHRAPLSTAEVAAILAEPTDTESDNTEHDDFDVQDYVPGQIVRSKDHDAQPMTVDDALGEMELVGHDFYLFINSSNNKPAVVYRRHAYDYGLIELNV